MLASLPVSMLNQSLDDLGIPIESTSLHPALGRLGKSFVIRRGAATSAVKAIAEFGHDNVETDGNEIDPNILVAFVECPPARLRKFDGAGLSAFRAV
jgi:hypothetical protein